jgi:hypothetical protein
MFSQLVYSMGAGRAGPSRNRRFPAELEMRSQSPRISASFFARKPPAGNRQPILPARRGTVSYMAALCHDRRMSFKSLPPNCPKSTQTEAAKKISRTLFGSSTWVNFARGEQA